MNYKERVKSLSSILVELDNLKENAYRIGMLYLLSYGESSKIINGGIL